ncbi:DUF7573 domain-containing protein [Halorubrum yunnanense]|uniref:DUF7573 domain-containing protein n=1 Tax=Halorubrum yunnanense TaxID=1526162 RepID=A0ABD5YC90_9EURY|nr:hypothetical protein [Halorubrum yunnanense]
MPEDRSLDEFAGGGVDDGPAAVDDERDDTDEEGDDADALDDADADPATPTAAWTTGGAACDRCGDSVARRWLDGDALVCAACKEW